MALRRAPGVRVLGASGTGPGRGLHVMSGQLYAVSGTKLYRISESGAATEIGDIDGTGRVSMANNGSQLAIITDTNAGYIYTAGALSAISDADFTTRKPGVCGFVDNYLVLVDENSGRFFCSDLADFSAYDSLDFATAESNPDNLLTLATLNGLVVLVGTDSTEIWQNVGGSGFPFARVPNGTIGVGGAAKHGICRQANALFLLAADRTVRGLDGNQWVPISHFGVNRALRDYARVDDCVAFPYTLDGHECVVFSFPSAAKTWVYDVSTKEWHEREAYRFLGWDVSDAARCHDKVYVQRATTGAIGLLEASTYTEWGGVLRPEWTYQNIYGGAQRLFHSRLELGIETGVGLTTGQGSDPELTLEVSDDGGKTFQTGPTRSIGAQGQFRQRVHWDRLGSAYDRVYRVSLSDAVPLTLWDTVAS